MRTLVVQAAGPGVLHCYIRGGVAFDRGTIAGRASQVAGVRGAHLVTTGKTAPESWCLVLEPSLRVMPDNAQALHRMVGMVARMAGCDRVGLLRPLDGLKDEPTTDLGIWLKL